MGEISLYIVNLMNINTKYSTQEKERYKIMENERKRFNDCMNAMKDKGCRALYEIPVDLMTIDPLYQTDERTQRSLKKLIENWDENKLEPITIVPHEEEGMFYIVNGYGRWTAKKQIEGLDSYLSSIVLLGLSKNPEERRIQEAELYAYQNRDCSKMTPIQNHGALKILGDPSVIMFEKLRDKYHFDFGAGKKTCSKPNTIGSYSETLNMIKTREERCFDFIFSTLIACGFDKKSSGYATYVLRPMRDIYDNYGDKKEIVEAIVQILRGITPIQFKSYAVTKYPNLESRSACSMYLEDEICRITKKKNKRYIHNNKIAK